MLLLLAHFFGGFQAFADDVVPSPQAQAAEAIRLGEEVQRAVKKNAWKGVERNYNAAVQTGAPLSALTHLHGAQAARQRGDLGAARARLLAATVVEPGHPEATEQLAGLDRLYGRVQLLAPIGSLLEDYEHHFDPQMEHAIAFAKTSLAETGAFYGLLPPGDYTIDGDPFVVVAGREVSFDLSLPPPPPPPVETKKKPPFWKSR